MIQPLPLLQLYRTVCCINLILNSSTSQHSVIFQSGLDAILDLPVVRINHLNAKNLSQTSSYDFFVVDLRIMDAQSFLDRLVTENFFNPNAKYLFVCVEPENSTISTLLSYYIFNSVFLDSNSGDLYTILPGETERYQEYSTEPYRVGRCSDEDLIQFSFYPDQRRTVWEGSNLTLTYSYEAPYSMDTKGQKRGIEIDLLEIFLERTNINADYVDKSNSTAYQAFLTTKKGRYDVSFGNLAVEYTVKDEFTVPYSCDSAFWYVPKPDVVPKWKLALSVFSLEVNLALLVSMLMSCVLWAFTHVLLYQGDFRRSIQEKMWSITTILLEQGVKLEFNHITPRFIVFLILQTLLIVNSTFKAKYTFFLSGTNHERTIETLEEVMEEGLKVGSTKFLVGVYQTTPEVNEYIQENFVECDTGPVCMNRSALDRDLAVLKPYKKVAYILDSFIDQHGHNMHHRLASPVLTLCNTFVVPKGHPVYPLLNRYVYLLVEHGFVDKVISKYDQIVRRRSRSTSMRNPKLGFDAVKGPIFVLIIGGLMGGVAFVTEKIIYARKGTKR